MLACTVESVAPEELVEVVPEFACHCQAIKGIVFRFDALALPNVNPSLLKACTPSDCVASELARSTYNLFVAPLELS